MQWQFGPFRLDLDNACLWRDEQRVRLRPKPFDLLVYLVEHAGALMTKEALLDAVWPDTAVAEGVLATSMVELRKALGDTARAPQFVATVHRRGYRFIAPVTVIDPPHSLLISSTPLDASVHVSQTVAHPVLVSREMELDRLHQGLAAARRGHRQVFMVTGEAGIGKTALIDTFVAQLADRESLTIGRGQCIDHYGAGEPYLPLLEAFGNLAQAAYGPPIQEILRQHAPSWLLQLPALCTPGEFERLRQGTMGATQERMLRELAEAVETLTTSHPLILVLEDLHWSDVSTLNWLAYIARRRVPSQLMILGTYRPVDAMVRHHPVRTVTQELRLHGLCEEWALDYLSEAGVVAYLMQRFGVMSRLERLSGTLYQRTHGNPLFMVMMADAMVLQGLLQQSAVGWECVEDGSTHMVEVPETLRQFIEQQFRSLAPEERALLEVASVAGGEFAAADIAAGIGVALEEVEECCDALARQHRFIRTCGTETWFDSTVTMRYAFIHALHQESIYGGISTGRRTRLHHQIGLRLEVAYGDQSTAIAAELADHFMRGRDVERAVQYLQYAGENALRRSAHQEAITHLHRGLELIEQLPDTPERAQRELMFHITLGVPVTFTKGYGSPEAEDIYTKALELCQQPAGEDSQLFPALYGLWRFHLVRAKFHRARELGEQLLRVAQASEDTVLLVEAHRALGDTLAHLGEFAAASRHLEHCVALYNAPDYRAHAFLYGHDPAVSCLSYAASVLWALGYPDQARERSQDACRLAQQLTYPFSIAWARIWAAWFYQLCRDVPSFSEQTAAALSLASEYGFPDLSAMGLVFQGGVRVMQGEHEAGAIQIHEKLAAFGTTGIEAFLPYYHGLLGTAYAHMGQPREGLRALSTAQEYMHKTGERFYEAELLRLRGEFVLALSREHQRLAETYFQEALGIARHQQAKSWELRAATSLSRLWQHQGKRDDARQVLSEVYAWFTEGFDTADLQEAKTILEELGA